MRYIAILMKKKVHHFGGLFGFLFTQTDGDPLQLTDKTSLNKTKA